MERVEGGEMMFRLHKYRIYVRKGSEKVNVAISQRKYEEGKLNELLEKMGKKLDKIKKRETTIRNRAHM